jgi:hypothetical protein
LAKYIPVTFFILIIFIGFTIFSVNNVSSTTAETYGQASMVSSNLGGDLADGGYSIKLTRENGLIMAGYTKSFGSGGSDLWLINTAPETYTMNGTITGSFQKEQWNVTFGGAKDDGAYSVIQATDDGYAAAGFTNSFGSGGSDMWLVKTNASGALQWKMTYGGNKDDAAKCLLQTSDGGYLLAGYTNSGVQSQTTWVIKTDPSGNSEWNKTYSGNGANSVIATSDGGYAFAVEYSDSFGLVKIDSSGNQLLNQKYVAPSIQASAQAIVQTDDGGFAIAGWTLDGSTNAHGTWLLKTDASGQLQWSKTYNGLGCYALIKTTSGGYAMTGDRAFLIITDSSGNEEWNKVYDGLTANDSQTRMQSLQEVTPNHFVMVGADDGGPYVSLQLNWIQVALKSGAQIIPPQTTILSPTNTTYNERNIPLSFYVNEPTRYLLYSINGVFNVTINGNTTLTNLANGSYKVTVVSTDDDYNSAASQTVSFSVMSTDPLVLPKVVIQSPTSQIYNRSQVSLIFSVNQTVFWSAYSLDGADNRTAIPNANMFLSLNPGSHTITVYAAQSPVAPATSATVDFTVTTPTYPTPYSNADTQAIQQVYQQFREVFGFFTSQASLILAASIIAVAIGIVIAVLIISRKATAEKQVML